MDVRQHRTGGLALTQDVYFTSDSVAQRGIVAFVADRGYLEGYTLDQRIARQLVKALEETCEALQAVTDDNPSGHLATLIVHAFRVGQQARAVFDIPSLFDDVTVDASLLIDELPDMVVPLAVLADAVGVPDMLLAGMEKAQADVARGVRNGTRA